MLNLPQQTILKIKKVLLHQQKAVEEQLKSIQRDDPVYDTTIEVSESGTESWQAEVHGRLTTLKSDLLGFSIKIKDSLLRLNKGTYGRCENCHQPIESQRLKAMPTATLCLICSKKSPKR